MGFSGLFILLKIVFIFFCPVAQASKSFQVIVLICIYNIICPVLRGGGFSHVLSFSVLKLFLGSLTPKRGLEYFMKRQAQKIKWTKVVWASLCYSYY